MQTEKATDKAIATDSSGDDGVLTVLSGLLREGADIHRCAAAQALGRIGIAETVDVLVEALLDEDEDVRSDAATALAKFRHPKANRQLLENLVGDPSGDVKQAAIDTLAATGHEQAVPWFRRLIRGRDDEVAWDDDGFFTSGWDDWADIQVGAIKAVAHMGVTEAVPDILAVFDDEDGQDISDTCFTALAKLGDPGIQAITGFLDGADDRFRRRAARVLGAAGSRAADRGIAKALEDTSAEVRLAAGRGLAARNPGDPRLEILLLDRDPQVRADAVKLCGERHGERLETLLSDNVANVQRAVLDIIADHPEIATSEPVTRLIRSLLDSKNAGLGGAAARALAAVRPDQAIDDLAAMLLAPDRAKEARIGAARGLARIGGEEAARVLGDVLAGDDRQLRIEATAAIAKIAGAEDNWPNPVGEMLLAAARGEFVLPPEEQADEAPAADPAPGPAENVEADDAALTDEAISFPNSTLAAITAANEPVVKTDPDRVGIGAGVDLSEEDRAILASAKPRYLKRTVTVLPSVPAHKDVRVFAARVINELPHDDVARELAALIGDSDTDVALAAAESLAVHSRRDGTFTADIVAALIAATGHTEQAIRVNAVRALGCADSGEVGECLRHLLDDEDSFVRAEAIRSIIRIGAARPEMAALLGDPDPAVRLLAAEAVAGVVDPATVERLGAFALSFEGYHGLDAARFLRQVDRERGNWYFLDILRDEDRKRYWKLAIEALGELNDNAATDDAGMV